MTCDLCVREHISEATRVSVVDSRDALDLLTNHLRPRRIRTQQGTSGTFVSELTKVSETRGMVTHATQTPSSKTLASNPTVLSWGNLARVSRLTVGVDQLCNDTRNGDPGRMLGMKHETVGNGVLTTVK